MMRKRGVIEKMSLLGLGLVLVLGDECEGNTLLVCGRGRKGLGICGEAAVAVAVAVMQKRRHEGT